MTDDLVKFDAAAAGSSLQSCQALFSTLKAIPIGRPAQFTIQFEAVISLLQRFKDVPDNLNVAPTINSLLNQLCRYCERTKKPIDEAAQSGREWAMYKIYL